MVKYMLDHLSQAPDQNVWGPIQDDEALFLYSIIRASRLNRILEIGGQTGYSAKNFLYAVNNDGTVYTCDLNPVPKLNPNHTVIIKNALDLSIEDVDGKPIDLLFFDCHDMVQMDMFERFKAAGIVTDKTILALHDTNLHYPPYNMWGQFVESEGGWAHQPVEREMVNKFKDMGYDCFSISTDASKHNPSFPIRHGVTVCQKFRRLASV
jgi:hypothetical protein